MNNVADDISHAYQDGFNDGVKSVLSKTGFYLVKDERVYAIDMPYEFKFVKSVDLMTGKVHYPTNRMRLRGKSDEELARFIANQRGWYCDFKDPSEEEYPKVLEWLKAEVEEEDGKNPL